MDERRFYIETEDVQLQAVLHLPDGVPPFAGVAVCHPHPRYGGDMTNNVVLAVVRALTDRGIAALRFNFRGVNGSTGSYDDGRGEARDAQHALDALAEREEIDADRLGIAGYSFGAMMASTVADERVRARALVALPREMTPAERLVARLSASASPLLLVAGDADHVCPEAQLRELGLKLPMAETEIVAGTDHFWQGYERDLDALVGPFFARVLLANEEA